MASSSAFPQFPAFPQPPDPQDPLEILGHPVAVMAAFPATTSLGVKGSISLRLSCNKLENGQWNVKCCGWGLGHHCNPRSDVGRSRTLHIAQIVPPTQKTATVRKGSEGQSLKLGPDLQIVLVLIQSSIWGT